MHLQKELGETARKNVLSELSLGKMALALSEIYNNL